MVGAVNRGRVGKGRSSSRSAESNSHQRPNLPVLQQQESKQQSSERRVSTRSQVLPQPQVENNSVSLTPNDPNEINGDSNSYGANSLQVDTPEVGSSSPQPKGRSTRKRGRTTGLSLIRHIPPGKRVQVELQCGKRIGKNRNEFKTQACVWLKQSCHIPLEVKSFKEITDDIKDRFWDRLQDRFELYHSTVKRRKAGPRVSSDERTSVSSPSTHLNHLHPHLNHLLHIHRHPKIHMTYLPDCHVQMM